MLRVKHRMLVPLLCCCLPSFAEVVEWQIDSAHSAAQFSVRHMMVSTVRGQFGKMTGVARFDAQDPSKSAIEATVDVSTINTREPKRDAHLKSPDFFDVEKFPSITFKSKRVEAAGQGRLKLAGDLTMRGVTREVVFDVEGPTPEIKDARGGARMGATATTRIHRKDFGITWNRMLEAGGVAVSDEVAVTIDVELARKP